LVIVAEDGRQRDQRRQRGRAHGRDASSSILKLGELPGNIATIDHVTSRAHRSLRIDTYTARYLTICNV